MVIELNREEYDDLKDALAMLNEAYAKHHHRKTLGDFFDEYADRMSPVHFARKASKEL